MSDADDLPSLNPEPSNAEPQWLSELRETVPQQSGESEEPPSLPSSRTEAGKEIEALKAEMRADIGAWRRSPEKAARLTELLEAHRNPEPWWGRDTAGEDDDAEAEDPEAEDDPKDNGLRVVTADDDPEPFDYGDTEIDPENEEIAQTFARDMLEAGSEPDAVKQFVANLDMAEVARLEGASAEEIKEVIARTGVSEVDQQRIEVWLMMQAPEVKAHAQRTGLDLADALVDLVQVSTSGGEEAAR